MNEMTVVKMKKRQLKKLLKKYGVNVFIEMDWKHKKDNYRVEDMEEEEEDDA